MRYAVIMDGEHEGTIVVEDGGVATFHQTEGGYNLELYQSRVSGFDPSNDEHWEELGEGKMYVMQVSSVADAVLCGMNWLCPFMLHHKVEFNQLKTK